MASPRFRSRIVRCWKEKASGDFQGLGKMDRVCEFYHM
jgi:hypothetical protein